MAGVAEAGELLLVLVEEHRHDGLVGDDDERKLLHLRAIEALEVRDALVDRHVVEEAELAEEQRRPAQHAEHHDEPEAQRLARGADERVDLVDEGVEALGRGLAGGREEGLGERAHDRADAAGAASYAGNPS